MRPCNSAARRPRSTLFRAARAPPPRCASGDATEKGEEIMRSQIRSRIPSPQSLGFTLLELLITVAIISLVATVALPLAELTVQRGKELELKRSLRQIRDGIDAYKRAA